ncbi:alpha-2-macroglobulin family protein [Psychromonas sp.]|uniref:alpha-2-macroglobulin family protein n=1 Tax=Psychromonas sp. TaxID=1884585 RepID=UPI0039E44190
MQPANINFVGQGPIVPKSERALPVTSINLKEVDLEILKVQKPEQFLLQQYYTGQLSEWDLQQVKNSLQSITLERYLLPSAKDNVEIASKLNLPKNLPSGWYVALLNPVNDYSAYNVKTSHFLLTNIGIQAKWFKQSVHLLVSTLDNGLPVKKGLVKAYNNGELIDAVVVENGRAQLNIKASNDTVLLVESDNEMAILSFKEVPLDLSEFAVAGKNFQPQEAFIYSNRDLVKPGEQLPINILLRDADGQLLSEQPINLRIIKPDNQLAYQKNLTSSLAGYYHEMLNLSDDAALGNWRIEVRTDPKANNALSQLTFQVQEFVPERMELLIDAPQQVIAPNQSLHVALTGRYLFGAKADGNQVNSQLTYTQVQHFAGKYKDYQVGQPFHLNESYLSLSPYKLDNEGKGELLIPAPTQEIKSPVAVRANLDLMEDGATGAQKTLDFISWNNKPIAAIRALQDSVGYMSKANFELLLLNAQGDTAIEGEVQLSLYKNQGNYYWSYEDGSGWTQHSQPQWLKISDKTVTTSTVASPFDLDVTWGQYRIVATEKQSKSETVIDFYAGWRNSREQMPAKPEHLDMQLDKSLYQNGDSLQLTFTSPIAGHVYLTVESDKVLWSKNLSSDAKQQQSQTINIDPGWLRHDIYLSAVVTGNDKQGIPKRLFGVKHIKLDRSERTLDLKLTLPEKFEPLTTVNIPVSLTNKSDQDTWVTLSMVDKGIINISGYQATNPANFFFGQRRYSTDVVDLYSRLFDLRPNPFATPRFGGDDVSPNRRGADLVESKTIILMSEPVQFDDAGDALVQLTLPDYNGEAQVIATTFSANEFGQTVASQKIAAPVIAELAVPRFLAPGDISTVHMSLFNNSGKTQQLSIDMAVAEGITIINADQLTRSITLTDGQRFSLPLQISLSDTLPQGSTSVDLSVSSADIDIKRSWTIPVRPVSAIVTKRLIKVLKKGESYTVSDELWNGLNYDPKNAGKVRLSGAPQINMMQHAQQLFSYPYGCAEQTTSRAFPYLIDEPELSALKQVIYQQRGLATNDSPERALLNQSIRRISSFQNPYGGFGLWGADGAERAWLSVYISEFLLTAEQSFPGLVDQNLLNNAQARLSDYVKNAQVLNDLNTSSEAAFVARTYAAYLLAQQGKTHWGDLKKIYDRGQASGWVTPLAAMQMAYAFHLNGDQKKRDLLLAKIPSIKRSDNYLSDYGSDVRDRALMVSMLNDFKDKLKLDVDLQLFQNIELLIAQSQTQHWFSTQENAALLKAGLVTQQLSQKQLSVEVNGQLLTKKGAISQNILPGSEITNLSDAPLYVQVIAQGRPKKLVSSVNQLQLSTFNRQLFYPDGREYIGAPIKVGDRFVVVVDINAQENLEGALLVELIPAGFILENPNLGNALEHQNMPYQGNVLHSYPDAALNYREYRNDRFIASGDIQKGQRNIVTYSLRAEAPGRYRQPPSYLEVMYRPYKNVLKLHSEQPLIIGEDNYPKQQVLTVIEEEVSIMQQIKNYFK